VLVEDQQWVEAVCKRGRVVRVDAPRRRRPRWSRNRWQALDESVVLISKGVNRHIETAARVARLHAAAENGETGFERGMDSVKQHGRSNDSQLDELSPSSGNLVYSAELLARSSSRPRISAASLKVSSSRSRVLDDIRSEPDMKSDRNAGPEGEG
jgi:hypothetical protein